MERRALAATLAAGKPIPALKALQEEEEEEPPADLEIRIPTSKVKLVIGPGGSKVKEIQDRTKCRVQIKKDEARARAAFEGVFRGLRV